MFSSSSGGFTENNENVWGGSPIGYLRGVCDPGDFTTSNPNATWVETFTTSEVTQGLGLGIGAVEGFANEVRGVSGRIISVTVRGANGQKAISGNALRSALGLHDDRVADHAGGHGQAVSGEPELPAAEGIGRQVRRRRVRIESQAAVQAFPPVARRQNMPAVDAEPGDVQRPPSLRLRIGSRHATP